MTRNNPLAEKLKGHHLILGSGSPRRKQFLEELGLDFEIRPMPVEEVYPLELKAHQISDYLAQLKAAPFRKHLQDQEIVLTSDTVVWYRDKSLAKASTKEEAELMLRTMSGDWHEVITSVCLTTVKTQKTVHAITKVKFKEFLDEELEFYINQYQPYDKAGAYGIQEWIGMIGISEIKGSYSNVVGLPTHLVYKTLMELVD